MREYSIGRLRGGFAVVWYDENGKRHRHSLRTSNLTEAARRLAAYKDAENRRLAPRLTVGELWAQYRRSLGDRPSATTMGYEWQALHGLFGGLLPSQITQAVVQEHISERRRAGRKDGTIWTELGRLRMVFSWAAKHGLLEKAPHVPRPQKPAPKELYLTAAQTSEFLTFCTMPHIKLFAILAWTTGARSSALLELTWDRVDFQRGHIQLANAAANSGGPKKGRATVPMNDTARAALSEAKEGALSRYVIEWAGQRVGSVKKGLKAAASRYGAPWISPHVFRHSAAVAMAERGMPMTEIAQYLGHSDSRLTERVYARFSPTYLRRAASALELG
jgi:integrase